MVYLPLANKINKDFFLESGGRSSVGAAGLDKKYRGNFGVHCGEGEGTERVDITTQEDPKRCHLLPVKTGR